MSFLRSFQKLIIKENSKKIIDKAIADGSRNKPTKKENLPKFSELLKNFLCIFPKKKLKVLVDLKKIIFNASCRIRTCGPLLRRQLLYPAELRKLGVFRGTARRDEISLLFDSSLDR